MDQKKAFDTVNYNIILYKLDHMVFVVLPWKVKLKLCKLFIHVYLKEEILL